MAVERLQSKLDATVRKARSLAEVGRDGEAAKLQNKVASLSFRIARKQGDSRRLPSAGWMLHPGLSRLHERLSFILMDALEGGPSQALYMPHSGYYVQWAPARRGIHMEFSANQYLQPSEQLPVMKLIELGKLGWHAPDRFTPNHWILLKTKEDAVQGSEAALITLHSIAKQGPEDIRAAFA